jgi:uncharacterized protein YjiS (DUF1127 family)
MPFQSRWFLEPYIYLINYSGMVTLEDTVHAFNDLLAVVKAADQPVYFLTTFRDMQGSTGETRDSHQATHLSNLFAHPNHAATIFIGGHNATLLRQRASQMSELFQAPILWAQSLREAEAFLRVSDETLRDVLLSRARG